MTLLDLPLGMTAIIAKVRGRGAFRKRIIEMGFVKGKEVKVIKKAPMRDPIEYRVMDYNVSLRRSEAKLIEVVLTTDFVSISPELLVEDKIFVKKKVVNKLESNAINVVLVGNPNSGKTSLFNYVSGKVEHVGNYSGVTVEYKKAEVKYRDYLINIIDLPGTYSLSAYSPEELYVRKFILNYNPDIVINVVDASNLERNLYLTTQLIDMDIRVVMALNMYDELKNKGDKFEHEVLGPMLGIPIIPTISTKGVGIDNLMEKVLEVFEDKDPYVRHIHINYGEGIERAIRQIQQLLKEDLAFSDVVSTRFFAIKLLEKDKNAYQSLSRHKNHEEIKEKLGVLIKEIEAQYNDDMETLFTDGRYGFISGSLKETYKPNLLSRKLKTDTEIIDTFITHKIFGFPIFIFFLWLMFQVTFSIGAYPMEWIEQFVSYLSTVLSANLGDGIFKALLIDGILSGVGGVIVFLPNILILFFFISLMEDTGYMARVAFIMDKLMHKIGLHGKSFIPLIMGFGCNVPAIMATRTLESRKDRLLTMLVNPLISCSARLPVYLLVVGAVFPDYSGTMLFFIYLIGILVAITIAIVFKRTLFRKEEVPFVMELPPYRLPLLRTTARHMWSKGEQYLKKIGGVILLASIIIWALGYFPRQVEYSRDYDSESILVTNQYNLQKESIENKDTMAISKMESNYKSAISELSISKNSEHQANSYIGRLGRFIAPVMEPLGFDWKMSISLFTGIAAKEIIVSTMGVLYHVPPDADGAATLPERLASETYQSGHKLGQKVFNPAASFAFLIFVLIYFPCIASVAAIKQESGSWKWALFAILYTTLLAWILAFISYKVGLMLI